MFHRTAILAGDFLRSERFLMSNSTKFTLGAGSSLTLAPAGTSTAAVKVTQLKTISYSGAAATYEDITNMDSPSGADGGAPTEEFAPATVGSGTAALQGVFNDGDPGQILLAASRQTQTLMTFTMQMKPRSGQAKGFSRTFTAYVQECNGPDAQYNKSATLSATLKISGPITDTPGA